MSGPLYLHWPTGPRGVPDSSSTLVCARMHPWLAREEWQDFLCTLFLRKQNRELQQEPGRQTRVRLPHLAGWRAAAIQSTGGLRRLSAWSFALGRPRSPRVPSRTPGGWAEVVLGRLSFRAAVVLDDAGEGRACASQALQVGAAACGGKLWAGLTLALLQDQAVPTASHADRVWVEIFGRGFSFSSLRTALDLPGFSSIFLFSLVSSTGAWARAQALHPAANAMGSFIAPSESHARGIALPWAVDSAEVLDARLLRALIGGRRVELVAVYAREADSGSVRQMVELSVHIATRRTVLCLMGEEAMHEFASLLVELGFEEVPAPPVLAADASGCFRGQRASSKSLAPSTVRANSLRRLGLHLQGSLPVARLSGGSLSIPAPRIWIEVGCNNWEMLLDSLPKDGSVWLLTLEPLVDKFAFIQSLRRPHHLVLPFAVAPKAMGHFSAIRSQNYSDFRGRPGARFQESGASSLLSYASGFRDHQWEGAAAQYANFREYLVPTVTLEWILGVLLGGREVEFLKLGCPIVPFFPFWGGLGSLTNPFTQKRVPLLILGY
ncbi:unnamed protein product [Symbiodinium natans]|uniref:Uncharacterized protein n=1 Tax=Symbiodinium natans TaxID=878477 RepID=A0A812NZX2_9DINO|nr:unnamed protein product [Symbiodinium natans]